MTEQADLYGIPAARARRIVSFGSEPVVAIVGTGFNTAFQAMAITILILAERSVITLTPDGALTVLAIILIGSIAGYASLLPWMYAARKRLVFADYDAPASWKIWAAWFIPFYNFWGPYQVMQAFRVRVTGGRSWSPALWWTGWLVFAVLDRVSGQLSTVSAFSTAVLAISFAAILASYTGLVAIIRDVSASFRPVASPDAQPAPY